MGRQTHATVVPGAKPLTSGVGEGAVHLRDRRGRYLWEMPAPSSYAMHYRSARHRREHLAGRVDTDTAKRPVPVYRALDGRVVRSLRNLARRRRSGRAT